MKLFIAGAGGFGREVAQMVSGSKFFSIEGFLDEDPALWGESVDGVPVLGGDDVLESFEPKGGDYGVVPCIGNSEIRSRIYDGATRLGYELPSIVHSRAYMAAGIQVGPATIVYPGVVAMTGCSLGCGVLVNAGVTLGHDVQVGDFSNIGPGASIAGRVVLGNGVLIGIGSTILETCAIGTDARIGAGATVISDVPSGATVVGVPARPIGNSSSSEG